MKRISSHLFFHGFPPVLERRMYLEINEDGLVLAYKSLDEENFEPYRTAFIDGIIVPAPISIQEFTQVSPNDYFLYDELIADELRLALLKGKLAGISVPSSTLIVDLQTNNHELFKSRFLKLLALIPQLSNLDLVQYALLNPRFVLNLPTAFREETQMDFMVLPLS